MKKKNILRNKKLDLIQIVHVCACDFCFQLGHCIMEYR